jgi:hypothetical protein
MSALRINPNSCCYWIVKLPLCYRHTNTLSGADPGWDQDLRKKTGEIGAKSNSEQVKR